MASIKSKRKSAKFLEGGGKTVIVAFDHGIVFGALPGSRDPAWVLEQVVAGGADGILVTPGIARRFAEILKGRISVILTVPTDPRYVEYAAKLGMDGIKTTFFGDVNDQHATRMQEDVAMACENFDMIYLDEIVPAQPGSYKANPDPVLINLAARKAAELGADVVKTAYTGDRKSFSHVVTSTFIPVVILGGEKAEDREVLQMTKDAVEAGGAGVAYGRNVWNRSNPKGMVEALHAVIHDGKSVEQALEML